MNRSPLHDVHVAQGARFVDFGGWEMPVHYGSVLAEHRAVRTDSGIFDVTHLGRFLLTGRGARGALDRLLSNDLGRIGPGRTQYTLMLNEGGGILDDLIVWWWSDDRFWVLPNAANHHTVMGLFSEEDGCEVRDLQVETVMLALQGPRAPSVFETILGDAPRRFRTDVITLAGKEVFIAGTGYTGETGGEICTDPGTGSVLFEAAIRAGAAPCGLGARDTLRLESGLPLWGADMDETTTPYEAGLGFAVSKGRQFVGSAALERQTAPNRQLIGFVLDDRGVPRHGYAVKGEDSAGVVTSGNVSPVLDKGVGLAYMSPPVTAGTGLEVEIRSRWVAATAVKPPFHKS